MKRQAIQYGDRAISLLVVALGVAVGKGTEEREASGLSGGMSNVVPSRKCWYASSVSEELVGKVVQ